MKALPKNKDGSIDKRSKEYRAKMAKPFPKELLPLSDKYMRTKIAATMPPEIKSLPSGTQVGGMHYIDKEIQPWDAMQAWMSPLEFAGLLRGSAIKYLARCSDKGGVEDLKKARHYLDKLIEVSGG